MDSIKELLIDSFMFSDLTDKEIEIVINAMNKVEVKKDQTIITEGDNGDDMYLVQSGKYICSKVFKDNKEATFLRYYEPGQVFGELCLLYNCPRAASIKCQEDGLLYGLDRATFNNIVKDSAIKRREKYEKFLTSVDLLKGLEKYECTSLADAVKDENYAPGEYIIKQGESGDRFFFVLAGEAVATKKLEPGKAAIEVMDYSKGNYFGELALINDAPRAANVVSKTDMHVLSLDKETFKRIMGTAEELLQSNIEEYEKYGKLDKDLYQLNNIK